MELSTVSSTVDAVIPKRQIQEQAHLLTPSDADVPLFALCKDDFSSSSRQPPAHDPNDRM
jgi:hypothetical protein